MLRRSLLKLVAAPACLSLSGCLAKKNEGQGVLLRVSSLPRTSMGPLYLAHEQGYFAEAGLDVSIRQLTYSTMAAPLLAGGELDASCLGLSPGLLNAAAKGSKVRIVACRGVFDPACGARGSLYGVRQVFPDGLQDLTLLKGKRVAIRGKANYSEFYLDLILGAAGLSSDDVQLVFLREPDAITALAAGRVDAILASDFEKSPQAFSQNIVRGIGIADVLPGLQYAFIAFGPSLLERDHDIGVRFLIAYFRGAADFRDGKTPMFLEKLARQSRMDLERAREACRLEFVPDGSLDANGIETYAAWAFRKGYCTQRVPADLLIDGSYFEKARRAAGGPLPA